MIELKLFAVSFVLFKTQESGRIKIRQMAGWEIAENADEAVSRQSKRAAAAGEQWEQLEHIAVEIPVSQDVIEQLAGRTL